MKVVFATHNLEKLKEVKAIFPSSVELLSLKDINCFDKIEETGATLESNAQLKADYITKHFFLNCFADDTGLEVESLEGKPGVYSARFAGTQCNSEDNIQKLLLELKNINNRKAQFRTVVFLNFNGRKILFEGICKGTILKHKTTEKGFGYDPVFKPDGFKKSFSEMTVKEKNQISHRGIAIKKLIVFFNKFYT